MRYDVHKMPPLIAQNRYSFLGALKTAEKPSVPMADATN
jgi:hypothetical protein